MQNRALRLYCNLHKYDHVSAFYYRLSWLLLPCFIQFRSLCLMCRQYHQFKCIPLEPPIYCLLIIQEYLLVLLAFLCSTWDFLNVFCFTVTQWWNLLPSFVTDCLNKPFHHYVDALGQYCSSLHWFCWFFCFVVLFLLFVVLFLLLYCFFCCICVYV